jgi:hypothetical protein
MKAGQGRRVKRRSGEERRFNAFVDMFSSGHKKKKVLDTFQYSDVNDEKIGFPFSP